MAPKRRRAATTAAPKSGSKDVSKLDSLFNSYKSLSPSTNEDTIGPEGVEAMCSDLGVQPTDRAVLVLCWKMRASRMGFFSRQEFKEGWTAMNTTTVSQAKKSLPKLVKEVDQSHYSQQSLHSFAFSFCLTEPGQKIIDVDTAAAMLKLTIPHGIFTQDLGEFLVNQDGYKKINVDQWNQFYRFSKEVKEDFSNYDDDSAWPLLLDNFVEWKRKAEGMVG